MHTASEVQLPGQVVSAPSHTNGVHEGVPDAPAPRTLHTPLVAAPNAVLHALHAPVHAELQQTPSTQLPDTHSSAAPHVEPCPACATH
jgi:hypothetical protein